MKCYADLNITDQGSLCMLLRVNGSSTAWRYPLTKRDTTNNVYNYGLKIVGNISTNVPDHLYFFGNQESMTNAYETSAGFDLTPAGASYFNQWLCLAWNYKTHGAGGTGGDDVTLYVNGVAQRQSDARLYPLVTNDAPLRMGSFAGALAEVAILPQPLDAEQLADLQQALNGPDNSIYAQNETTIVSYSGVDAALLGNELTFSIADEFWTEAAIESQKGLWVNDYKVWPSGDTPMAYRYETHTYDVATHLNPGTNNTIRFKVTNGHARKDTVIVYFHSPYLRQLGAQSGYTVSTEGAGNYVWQHTHTPDTGGYLAPFGESLDERVHSMAHVRENTLAAIPEGTRFSYYTTMPATQLVPVNNRFLNGLYASALGCEGVYSWSFGYWGPQPWDDLESWHSMTRAYPGCRGWGSYQFVFPTWEPAKVYDTIPYEVLREGIEDSRVIATLKSAIDAPAPSPAQQAAADYLDGRLTNFSYDYYPHYRFAKMWLIDDEPQIVSDRSAEMLQAVGGDPTNFDAFDDVRRQMIYHILFINGSQDCNTNGVPDEYDIAAMTSQDCNTNGIPDECELVGNDCNTNGIPDDCELAGNDCNTNSVPDECDIAALTSLDCNSNGVPDECELVGNDCNTNGIPDECELAGNDCNTNGIPDECDIAASTSQDCNSNGIPDECDIVRSDPYDPWSATSLDTNQNGIPDECEPVCLGNSDGSTGSPLLTPADLTALAAACDNDVDGWLAVVGSPAPCTFWNNDLDGDWDVDDDDWDILNAAYGGGSRGCLGACCIEFGGVTMCSMLDFGRCSKQSGTTFYPGEHCIDICDRCDHIGCP